MSAFKSSVRPKIHRRVFLISFRFATLQCSTSIVLVVKELPRGTTFCSHGGPRHIDSQWPPSPHSARGTKLTTIVIASYHSALVSSTAHSIECSKRTHCHIMVNRWSSSSYRHRRRGNISGGGIGKQYFVLPFLSILIISMANTVMAESVEISPNTRQKLGLGSSSTTYKHRHGVGAAIRRILYSQPRNIERSLQGNNVSAELCV